MNDLIFYFFNRLSGQSPVEDWLTVFFAEYFAYILVVLLIALLYFWKTPRHEKARELILALAALVLARGILTEIIRFFYHHPRPFVALQSVHLLFIETSWSFPSGHAAFFFALSTILYFYHRRLGITFFILSTAMGIARIMAGVHYPFDILGGAIVGIASGIAVYRLRDFPFVLAGKAFFQKCSDMWLRFTRR